MKIQHHRLAALTLCAASLGAFAHGDEPHGDAPHAAGAAAPAGPRFEAATEAFELVGRLEDGALTLFVNRFETNEPVLQATVELESGAHKAVARYQADQGSYVVDAPRFVAALGQPGTHPVVVTLTAAGEADLLEASLTMAAPTTTDPQGPGRGPAIALAGALGLGLLGFGVWQLRRRRRQPGARA